jgi:rod shape-determining protein MreC
MTVEGDVYGILEPRRVGGEPLLVLTGTPRHVELEADALIVTSGHGGVFPRGIPVGVVIGAEGGEEGWQRNYLVRPLVAPSEMTYVLVLGEPQRALEGHDLALLWGIRPMEAAPVAEAPLEAPPAAPGAAPTGPPAPAGAPAPPRPPAETGPRLLGEPVVPPQ